MGDGNQRNSIARLAAKYALTNVRILPLQPAETFPSVLAAADILLINQRGSVDDMSLPSKLTSYFASGRPVVAAAAAHSETARELAWSSGGLVVRPDDPAELLDALVRVVERSGLAGAHGAVGVEVVCGTADRRKRRCAGTSSCSLRCWRPASTAGYTRPDGARASSATPRRWRRTPKGTSDGRHEVAGWDTRHGDGRSGLPGPPRRAQAGRSRRRRVRRAQRRVRSAREGCDRRGARGGAA